jgi:hypothetical protein
MTRAPWRRLGAGAVPAAVGMAAAIVVLTVGAHVAGPALLRDHANGAVLLLLGLGVPLHFSAGAAGAAAAGGTVTPGTFPALALASLVVAGTTILTGWFAARNGRATPGRTALWFAAFATLASAVVSHARPIAIAGVPVDLSTSAPLAFVAGWLWAMGGMTVGAMIARSFDHRRLSARGWLAHSPAAATVVAAVALVGVSACSAPSTLAATPETHVAAGKSDAGTTTSTTAAPATTDTTGGTTAAGGSGAARPSTRSGSTSSSSGGTASRSATPGSTGAAASAAAGYTAPAAGFYYYDTSGSTSSLLGKKSFPSVTSLKVDGVSSGQQHSLRQLVSPNGDGFIVDQVLQYQAQGVAIVQQRLTLTQGGKKSVRTLKAAPATLAIPFGAPVGYHTEFNLTGSSISGRETVELLEAGTAVVGGQTVPTVLLKTVLQISGNVTGTIETQQWWTPVARIPVKEHLSGSMRSGLTSVKTDYDATLQKLTPG